MHHATLHARAPFTLTRSLCFLDNFSPAAGEQNVCATHLDKVHSIRGRAIACRVAATSETTTLAVTLRADKPIDTATRDEALARLRFQLSLDDDLEPFYARARKDRAFAPIALAQHGHHHVKFPSPFEIAAWAVLAQRTPMLRARKVKDALVARFGPPVTVDGAVVRAFPEAARLAGEPVSAIATVVRDPRRAAAIHTIARAFADVDETFLREGPFEEVEAWLSALPRIGAWSTAFVLFRGLGRMPRLVMKEGQIFDCARAVYGAQVSTKEIVRIADSYGEHCGYWALYLRSRGVAEDLAGAAE
jgi:DNA-3-methyladenine glycosylase II